MKACLTKLGLKVNEGDSAVPSLSSLHLSSNPPSDIAELASSWQTIITNVNGEERIEGENDTFILKSVGAWNLEEMAQALPADQIVEHDKLPKTMILHEKALPESKQTPYFNHNAFFANLEHHANSARLADGAFGKVLLYGEVVTSTNTMLEKYDTLPRQHAISY